MNIIGVHLDRRNTQPLADAVVADVKKAGREAIFFNRDAGGTESDPTRQEILDAVKPRFAEGKDTIKVLLHSIAFGTLKPFFAEDPLNRKQMTMTLDVMANSLVYWSQDIVNRGLMGEGGRIYAMTSAGSHRVWRSYGAVSAAKAALESHCRQLALELAPKGITANAIQAGVTDTPALRKIPGNEEMIERTKQINPSGRLTTPEDVARALVHLSHADMGWLTGNVLRLDGGEDIVG
jgi:enoyl-[acyl-carrier protein] reductase III